MRNVLLYVRLPTRIFRIGLPFYCFFFLSCSANAQSGEHCAAAFREADSLANKKYFRDAGTVYFRTFKETNNCQTGDRLFAAALVCLRAGETDSMFRCLAIIVNRKSYNIYPRISAEPAFLKFKRDKRWNDIKSKLDHYHPTLVTELNSLHLVRATMEAQCETLKMKFGQGSRRYLACRDLMVKTDTVNTFKLESIIRTAGRLGVDQV